MVGAGALGCEYLKMFALMGLSTSKGGRFYVTDDD
jgi:ubiquitin-activating enzyme E1